MKKLPVRKCLPHEAPFWVDSAKADYFITICCARRGRNQLAKHIARGLIETIKHRNGTGIWYVHLALIMPDHIHLLISFPESNQRIQTIMSKWKEWTAKSLKIEWQRDFFEHRLRKEENFREKADYIFANPIRAGLVEKPEDWPYVLIAEPWSGQRAALSADAAALRPYLKTFVCGVSTFYFLIHPRAYPRRKLCEALR